MSRFFDSARFTRRLLGKQTFALAISTISALRFRSAEAAGQHLVYVFDPDTVDQVTGLSCASCSACRRHAEHKLFASLEAANARRAHKHCRCGIRAVPVSRSEYESLFVAADAIRRSEFDHRWTGGLEMPAVRVR
jgi:hypothetical protein